MPSRFPWEMTYVWCWQEKKKTHLGAVGVSQVRPNTHDSTKLTTSTPVTTLSGHKEDAVVTKVAHALAVKLNKNVVVSCGIHVDDITPDEMRFVSDAIERFCDTCSPDDAAENGRPVPEAWAAG
jgi:hypothetical protein